MRAWAVALVAVSCSPAASPPARAPDQPSQAAKERPIVEGQPQAAEEGPVVEKPSPYFHGWWCSHRSSQPGQDVCAEDAHECEAKRELVSIGSSERDWTSCSEKARVYCHDVSRRASHIVDRRRVCYETEPACASSSRAFSPATNMRASSCFAVGADGRMLRPD